MNWSYWIYCCFFHRARIRSQLGHVLVRHQSAGFYLFEIALWHLFARVELDWVKWCPALLRGREDTTWWAWGSFIFWIGVANSWWTAHAACRSHVCFQKFGQNIRWKHISAARLHILIDLALLRFNRSCIEEFLVDQSRRQRGLQIQLYWRAHRIAPLLCPFPCLQHNQRTSVDIEMWPPDGHTFIHLLKAASKLSGTKIMLSIAVSRRRYVHHLNILQLPLTIHHFNRLWHLRVFNIMRLLLYKYLLTLTTWIWIYLNWCVLQNVKGKIFRMRLNWWCLTFRLLD